MSKEQWLSENLRADEVYAGIILGENGKPDYHLFLLPGQATDVTWQQAVEFAKKAGGDLPTRREQSLLFANAKAQFEPRWYWSAEEYEPGSRYAWFQTFYSGFQDNFDKSYAGRARAVRRLDL